MSKTESRFKSKLESLKKFQHSASANTAVEKARSFFRSLELKHVGNGGNTGCNKNVDRALSSRPCNPTTNVTPVVHVFPSKIKSIPGQSSSLIPQSLSLSPPSSPSIMDDSSRTILTNDSSVQAKAPVNAVATARIIRVINPHYSNSKDTVAHQVLYNERVNDRLVPAGYHSPKLTAPTYTTSPRLHYNGQRQNYAFPMERHRETQGNYNIQPFSPVSALSSNKKYSAPVYPNKSSYAESNISNDYPPRNQMSTSLYRYRPLVCRHMDSSPLMSSSFHEPSHSLPNRFCQTVPLSASSSSVVTWNQSVRRLNTEYASTISALQQAKESFQQQNSDSINTISQYADFVARGINDLSNSETKKASCISFCLTASAEQHTPGSPSQITRSHTQPDVTSSSLNTFCKLKLVRPVELDSFIPTTTQLPKLESAINTKENNERSDSIANIIKKFNNFNNSPSTLKSSTIKDNENPLKPSDIKNETEENPQKLLLDDSTKHQNARSNLSPLPSVTDTNATLSLHNHMESSLNTYELDDIPYESPPSSLGSSSSVSQDSTSSTTTTSSDENPLCESNASDNNTQEETTYTIETFYKPSKDLSFNNQQVLVIRENTTEEQFNSARDLQIHDKNIRYQFPTQNSMVTNEAKVLPLVSTLNAHLSTAGKQTTLTASAIENQNKIYENHYSLEPLSCIASSAVSHDRRDTDDPTKHDIVTANPHTCSPRSNSLVNSFSSSSTSSATSSTSNTASSASTVLLSGKVTIPLSVASIPKTSNTANSTTSNNNFKPMSQLPRRVMTTSTTTTASNVSRIKQPTKIVSSPPSKLKAPSSTIIKAIKPSTANNTSTITTTVTTPQMRKSTGTTNQPTSTSSNFVNKVTQEQSPVTTSTSGKRQPLVNGTNMTESQNPTGDSSLSIGKNRVKSMVHQFNAVVSSVRPTVPSTVSAKRTTAATSLTSGRRPVSMEATTNLMASPNKTFIPSPNRPSVQRAMTINSSSVTPSPPSTPPTANNNVSSMNRRRVPLNRSTSNVKEGLLRWCQAQVAGYPNVSVTNLSSSWSDGLAFCALTHHFFPDAFDFNALSSKNRKENFELAFRTAEQRAGVPRLLDVSDMLLMGNTPDYKCIFTYLNSFLAKVKDMHPAANRIQQH